eukprot:3635973-Rhodomonas_salina.2
MEKGKVVRTRVPGYPGTPRQAYPGKRPVTTNNVQIATVLWSVGRWESNWGLGRPASESFETGTLFTTKLSKLSESGWKDDI